IFNGDFQAPALQVLFPFRLNARKQHSHPHAAADAESCQAAPRLALLHLVEQRRRDADAGTANRMTERDGTAVDVQSLRVETQIAVTRYDLSGEGFVELD